MKKNAELIDIVKSALGTLDHRQSFSPGMFEPIIPLFKSMQYDSAAVYITDDYPDRMQVICGYDCEPLFPSSVALGSRESLYHELIHATRDVPGVMVAKLFSHDRELGSLAVTSPTAKSPKTREAFEVLAKSLSVMAYVERIRTNARREREERDVFFAQSLTNRLLIREAPKVKNLRLGFEFTRSLEAGGDFFDLAPDPAGNLFGFVGCCNGKGLRTVLEVCSIMREVYRAYFGPDSLDDTVRQVNDLLVKEKHRAHQASLCLFHVDVVKQRLRLVKAGRLGILLCGPGSNIVNISSPGAAFLGMLPKMDVALEEYEFAPGQSLLCLTDGFYSARNVLNARPQLHWFLESLTATLGTRRKKPLANAIFDAVNREADHTARPDDSMLAVSVESTGRTGMSGRMSGRLKSGS